MPATSNGWFPDVVGEIYDAEGGQIRVEVEYWAENYKSHGHPFGACDLIISFLRTPGTSMVRGVPVWSFYTGKKTSRYFKFCLWDDINDAQTPEDCIAVIEKKKPSNKIFYDNGKWVRLPNIGQTRTVKKVDDDNVAWDVRQVFNGFEWEWVEKKRRV